MKVRDKERRRTKMASKKGSNKTFDQMAYLSSLSNEKLQSMFEDATDFEQKHPGEFASKYLAEIKIVRAERI